MSVRLTAGLDAPELLELPPPELAPRRPSGGVMEVLRLAFPLVLSSSAHAAKLFSDRLMLAWYDDAALAAAFVAGLASFMFIIFLGGIAGYANVFVAQYTGAGRPERTGLAIWQALLFALFGGLAAAGIAHLAPAIFNLFHHTPIQRAAEESYFRVVTSGAVFTLLLWGVGSFWTGRNKPWTIVIVNAASIFSNVALNWLFIFGAGGCSRLDGTALAWIGDALNALAAAADAPRWGIFGAGFATVLSEALSVAVFFALLFSPRNRREFGTWPKRAFDRELMGRLLRYGLPNGVQGFLDIAAFTLFNLIMGNYGPTVAAATAIAFSVNTLAFNPMLGVGMAVAVLVGQSVGAKDIPHAKRSVRSARLVLGTYMAAMAGWFFFSPETVAAVFSKEAAAGADTETLRMTARFLRYIAVFLVFDGLFILYSNAIRGAGDTKVAMYLFLGFGWGVFALPALVAHYGFGAGPNTLWIILVCYIIMTGMAFYYRYRQGAWTRMRVIEG